jgi:thiol-disulfide isomerase/thioredoxin
MVTKTNDSEFLTLIANHPKVVVKYYADWCGSCRLFAPKYKKLSEKEEYTDVLFLDVNAEENPEARKFGGVNNLPFFAVIKDGNLMAGDTTAKEEGVEKMIQMLN